MVSALFAKPIVIMPATAKEICIVLGGLHTKEFQVATATKKISRKGSMFVTNTAR